MRPILIFLSSILLIFPVLSRADTFNITNGIADHTVVVSRLVGDYSVVISNLVGDYSISVKKGGCGFADHSVSISNFAGDYSVSVSNLVGDYSVIITNFGADHSVCVPEGSSKKQIEEYVAAVVVVAIKLGKL